jgi:hypothetical protein
MSNYAIIFIVICRMRRSVLMSPIFHSLPSATCFSKGTEHSMLLFPLLSVQFLPIIHILRISFGSSRRSSSICLRAPALEPNST